jgi:CheY-like chemotaxis protein
MANLSILWADDEIDLLSPHLSFLESKGYRTTPVNNGLEAVQKVSAQDFDLVLLDENMPGLSGLETLAQLKEIKPLLPVIMVTKSEEELLMEEAIGSKIADYLIKPVHPRQLLSAILKITDQKRLVARKTNEAYRDDFGELGMSMSDNLDAGQWSELYQRLVHWELALEQSGDVGMKEVFAMQKAEANRLFVRFIKKNYTSWFASTVASKSQGMASPKLPSAVDAPTLSHQVLQRRLLPLLDHHPKILLLVIDNFRLDQFRVIEPILGDFYKSVEVVTYYSILPTSTEYARNALFAGMPPAEIQRRYPDRWWTDRDEHSHNMHESFFFGEWLKRNGRNTPHAYQKITSLTQAKQALESGGVLSQPVEVMVYNFVDMLSHARSEMNIIKELAEDEAAYRSITRSWFEHSPLLDYLQKAAERGYTLVLTTDHGMIKVEEPVRISGDREMSNNLRYKEGKNLQIQDDHVYAITHPEQVQLPRKHLNSGYILAGSDQFFCYPNNFHQYAALYRNSFQHGGISLEECIVPWGVFKPKEGS